MKSINSRPSVKLREPRFRLNLWIAILYLALDGASHTGSAQDEKPKAAAKKITYVVELIGYGGRIDKTLGRATTWEAADEIERQWAIANPMDLRLTRQREIGVAHRIGSLSEKYEVGKLGPSTISSGKIRRKDKGTSKVTESDDPGGKSYGSYQLASKRGLGGSSVNSFVSEVYPSEFEGLKPGTDAFDKKWNEIVERDVDAFRENEHQFIKETHFEPVANALKDKFGLDLDTRSQALKEVIWSTAVQHGPPEDAKGHAVQLLTKSMESLQEEGTVDVSKMSDEDLINGIYDERSRKGSNGKMVHFPGLTTLDRFDQERKDALKLLKSESMPKNPE